MVTTCPENSTLGVCDLIDEGGTGMAVLVERLGTPLGTFLLIIGIVVGVLGIFGAIIFIIKKNVTKIK